MAFAFDFTPVNFSQGRPTPEAEQVLKEGLGPERYAELLDSFAIANMPLTTFVMEDRTSPAEVLKLKEFRATLTGPQHEAAIIGLLGPQRAANYLGKIRNNPTFRK
ncbi:MAG: hypothetical protein QM813_07245 [Verrucomicrobiota bacterium]